MIDFLQHLFAFIFALGILVTFHEFGHFWVARKCDVKILTFSIGFGKPLWSRNFGQDKSKFVIAALPLGGYVKMLDEREGEVPESELDRTFNRKSLAQRTAIVLAGPVFNFIFAIVAFWIMFMIGLSGLKPIVGDVEEGSIAYQAGLYEGVEIIAVDSRETKTWTMVVDAFINKIVDGGKVDIRVRDNSVVKVLSINLENLSIDDMAEQGLLSQLGITPKKIKVPAIIGDLHSGLPADAAGLLAGDLIISANGDPIDDWRQWVKYIQKHPEKKITVEVKRQDKTLDLLLIPNKKVNDDGSVIGFIGASNAPVPDIDGMFAKESYGLLSAFLKGVEKTWDMSWLTLRMLGKMIAGQVSVKNLSGPISIAQYAGDSAQSGAAAFLWFLGIVSVSLGVLNLLPIPLLDGGHLLYYFVEFFKGSAVSESIQIIGQQIGFTLLLGLMLVVFYNDIVRLTG
ncbi:MAG: regulator of sigma E protease [Gammaproteobacteria bacterium]|jgi:regulator of sigma E protease